MSIEPAPSWREGIDLARVAPTRILGLLGYARGGTRYWLPYVHVGTSGVLAAAVSRTR